MYEINRTHARWAFKDLLGQANHFLITILVGLNGVRDGLIGIDEEFSTSWNPQSVERSADRSRAFVLDLALVRAIDALDTYMMMSARKPRAISDINFGKRMDGTGRSVSKRLAVFEEFTSALPQHHKAALEVSIEWRNKRVHSLAQDKIDSKTLKLLSNNASHFKQGYSGLDIEDFLKRFTSGASPTFKDAAAVIRMTHEAVEHYDSFLLQNLDAETYLKESLLAFMKTENANPGKVIRKTWDSEKKEEKVLRLLRMVGVNKTESVRGRRVPDQFVYSLVDLKYEEVLEFLED